MKRPPPTSQPQFVIGAWTHEHKIPLMKTSVDTKGYKNKIDPCIGYGYGNRVIAKMKPNIHFTLKR